MHKVIAVPPELKGTMCQYRRLLLSYADFKHAKLAAEYILSRDLHENYPNESYVTLPALNCSMIVAYARPFSGSGGRRPGGIPDLPKRYLRILSPEEREVHETAIFDRNKYLAHSDDDAANLEPVRLQIASDHEILMPLVNWRMAPLEKEPTEHLRSAATKLFEATINDRLRLEPLLLPYFRIATPDTIYTNSNDDEEVCL